MGDPITMAMIGAGVGAVTNPRKPLQGALLGGALGGFGGAAMGAGNAAATATMTGASAVPAGAATTITPMTAGATYKAAAPGMVANFGMPTMPTYAATGGSTGLIGSTTAPVTMMDRLKAVGDFNRQNPMVGQMGSSAFQSLNEPQPMAAAAQPGLMRGNPMPIEDQQMANFQPRPVSLI
jgi:hypothetical protein